MVRNPVERGSLLWYGIPPSTVGSNSNVCVLYIPRKIETYCTHIKELLSPYGITEKPRPHPRLLLHTRCPCNRYHHTAMAMPTYRGTTRHEASGLAHDKNCNNQNQAEARTVPAHPINRDLSHAMQRSGTSNWWCRRLEWGKRLEREIFISAFPQRFFFEPADTHSSESFHRSLRDLSTLTMTVTKYVRGSRGGGQRRKYNEGTHHVNFVAKRPGHCVQVGKRSEQYSSIMAREGTAVNVGLPILRLPSRWWGAMTADSSTASTKRRHKLNLLVLLGRAERSLSCSSSFSSAVLCSLSVTGDFLPPQNRPKRQYRNEAVITHYCNKVGTVCLTETHIMCTCHGKNKLPQQPISNVFAKIWYVPYG